MVDCAQAASIADVVFNVSNTTSIDLYPADYFTFYADAVVPANSSVWALIDVSLPLDGLSAVATVVSFTVVSLDLSPALHSSLTNENIATATRSWPVSSSTLAS